MAANRQWIEDFYQDVKAQQISYTNQIPPLWFDLYAHSLNNAKYDKMAFKKELITDDLDLSDKERFELEHTPIYETLATAKYANQHRMKIDEFLYKCTDGEIIIDNALFESQHFDDYHAIVLSSLDDYVNNEFSKMIDTPDHIAKKNQAILGAYTSCILLLNSNNKCFYVMPLYGEPWLFNKKDTKVTKLHHNQLIVSEPLHLPIINVSFSYLQTVLNALPLNILRFDRFNVNPMYQYKGIRNTGRINNEQNYDILVIERMKQTDVFDNVLDREQMNCRMVNALLYDHAKLKCDHHGEIYYEISHFNQFWQDYYRHLKTQNVNDILLKSANWLEKRPVLAQLVEDNWSELNDNVQVESADLPIDKHKILKPLVKPQGLNEILESIRGGDKQQYYVYQDKLLQLEYSAIDQHICVRSINVC